MFTYLLTYGTNTVDTIITVENEAQNNFPHVVIWAIVRYLI